MSERTAKAAVMAKYHQWLISLIDDQDGSFSLNYRYLMEFLDNFPFEWVIELDRNRYLDGIELRERFDYEQNSSKYNVVTALLDKKCSCLECLVALFVRYSDDILVEPGDDSLAPELFYTAMSNLGLLLYDDFNFDEEKVTDIVSKWRGKKVYIFHTGGKKVDLFLEVGRFVNEKYV